jgi:hypothetical protein
MLQTLEHISQGRIEHIIASYIQRHPYLRDQGMTLTWRHQGY